MSTWATLNARRMILVLIAVLLLAGCQEPAPVAPTPSPETVATETARSLPPTEAASTATPAPTETAQTLSATSSPTAAAPTATTALLATATTTPETAAPETEEDLLVDDNFRDSGSGWPETQQFDNYYIGYHEPEWYHVELQAPHDYYPVVLEGQNFEDVSVEAEAFVETSLSAEDGDFRYGLVLRRAGKQFYAFTIDPRSGAWAVLKSSPTSLETLIEGNDESIKGLSQSDRLRVDALGSAFTFHINDNVVAELEDDEYNTGEIGFFVQTFASERVHIHYDTMSIREVNAPAPKCTIISPSLNLRPGPGIAYAPVIRSLPQDTRVIPLTQSAFLPWIQVQVANTDETGWLYASEPYAFCNFDISELPGP